ncbi:MAG: hypothetical protein K8I60_05310 [Anaerolineae bacterium]|nr:hypothetical protein [Anaerolineae bacterium]
MHRDRTPETSKPEDRRTYEQLLKAERDCLSKAMFERLQREARRYSAILEKLATN